MFGNVLGKLTLALTFSIPLTVFFLVFRKSFVQFIQTPLILEDIVNFRKEELIDRIYKYELRQQVQEKEMEKLVDIAGKDPLTSLANRRKFESAFGAEWSRCQREKSCLTIVIGDVDYFKQYNDTYGHSQGDACLKTLAALWGTICERPFDVAARIGGEEFALILPNTSPEQILPRLEQFRDDLKRANIPHMASTIAPYVTMSIGAAGYIPKGKAHPMRMFDLADQRLYSAKQSGRNKIVIA
jgi:diguanylate cyclase (GGDEF)-like protein